MIWHCHPILHPIHITPSEELPACCSIYWLLCAVENIFYDGVDRLHTCQMGINIYDAKDQHFSSPSPSDPKHIVPHICSQYTRATSFSVAANSPVLQWQNARLGANAMSHLGSTYNLCITAYIYTVYPRSLPHMQTCRYGRLSYAGHMFKRCDILNMGKKVFPFFVSAGMYIYNISMVKALFSHQLSGFL